MVPGSFAQFSSQQLRAFLVVAEELNMRRAAERLFVSQPGLSLSIRQLERQVAVLLFDRTSRGLRLTAAGAIFQDRVGEIVALADAAVEKARSVASMSRRIRVGYLHSVGMELLTLLIIGFEREQSEIVVETKSFNLSDPTAGLSGSTVEVAFTRGPVLDPNYQTLQLRSEQWAVCLPLHHPLASRNEISVGEVLEEPVIAAPESAGSWREFWTAAGMRKSHPAHVVAVASTLEEEFLAVARGRGVSFTTTEAIRGFRPTGVCFVPIGDMEPAQLTMSWRNAHPDVLRFVNYVRNAAAELFESSIAR